MAFDYWLIVWGVTATPRAFMNDRDLISHLDQGMRSYKGDLTQLERAIGAYLVGRKFGWKIMMLVHDRKTIAKYGEILGLNFQETLPAEGELASKSIGWAALKKVSSFWRAVKGEYPGVKSAEVK